MVNGIAYSQENLRRHRERTATAEAAEVAARTNRTVVCAIMGWVPPPIAPTTVRALRPLGLPRAALPTAA
jgi:hypothetical protein